MRSLTTFCCLIVILSLHNYSQSQENSAKKHDQKADQLHNIAQSPSAPTSSQVNQAGTKDQQNKPESQTRSKWEKAFSPETWSAWAALLVGALVFVVYVLMLSSMRDTAKRQLRAYVVAELGSIVNVAEPIKPIPTPVGYTPSAAANTFPWGPVVYVQIKNTGQTPAFKVEHWGNICIREFPLKSPLPDKPLGHKSVSIVGPGIMSTKTMSIGPVLTDAEVESLRNQTMALYIYGEIFYEDAFRDKHSTRYRMFHNQGSGPVGVSTDLTFYAEGNEAD